MFFLFDVSGWLSIVAFFVLMLVLFILVPWLAFFIAFLMIALVAAYWHGLGNGTD